MLAPVLIDGETTIVSAEEANVSRHDWLARERQPDRSVHESLYRRRDNFVGNTTAPMPR